jgi:hypothetical protein
MGVSIIKKEGANLRKKVLVNLKLRWWQQFEDFGEESNLRFFLQFFISFGFAIWRYGVIYEDDEEGEWRRWRKFK